MVGFGRAILIAILAAASFVIFINLAFFFPWYLTMVETGFAVSQMVATDNYLTLENYNNAKDHLKSMPIFSLREDSIEITAVHDNGWDAIEQTYNSLDYYYNLDDERDKPYVQMGNLVRITVFASYPFRMELFGGLVDIANLTDLTDIDTSFSMSTITTRHYKDLDYEYSPFDNTDTTSDNFIDWNMGP